MLESFRSDRASITHSISLNSRQKMRVKERIEKDNGAGVGQRDGVREKGKRYRKDGGNSMGK